MTKHLFPALLPNEQARAKRNTKNGQRMIQRRTGGVLFGQFQFVIEVNENDTVWNKCNGNWNRRTTMPNRRIIYISDCTAFDSAVQFIKSNYSVAAAKHSCMP